MNNKKGIIPFGIIAIAIAIIAVGFLAFNPFKAEANQGIPCSAQNPCPSQQDNQQKQQITPCPDGFARDNTGNCVQLKGADTTIPCPTGQARDNTGVCVALQCAQGQIRNAQGQCVFAERTADPALSECIPSGRMISAYAIHKNKVGKSTDMFSPVVLTYQFQVTSDCEANYYVEGGIANPNKLTIFVTQPSACDGNNHYAGKWIRGSKNTQFSTNRQAGVIDVVFYPTDYGKEGNFQIVGGVYTGCFKDGGKVITEIPPQSLSIKNSYTDNEIALSQSRII